MISWITGTCTGLVEKISAIKISRSYISNFLVSFGVRYPLVSLLVENIVVIANSAKKVESFSELNEIHEFRPLRNNTPFCDIFSTHDKARLTLRVYI